MPGDSEAARRMAPLIERGRAERLRFVGALPVDERTIGDHEIDVVRLDDFFAHVELCFRHIVRNGRPLHILCEDGAICASFARRNR